MAAPARKTRHVGPSPSARSSAESKLFSVALAAFSSTRNALVKELRRRGSTAEAAKISAYKRPTRTAWALNQVARREPHEVRAVLDAIATVRRAQSSTVRGRGWATLRDASRALNVRVGAILGIAKQMARDDGAHLTSSQERTIARALHALPFAPRAEVERFVRGTLVADLEAASDAPWFGTGTIANGAREHVPKRKEEHPPRSAAAKETATKLVRARAERERLAGEKVEAKRAEREAVRLDARVAKAEREASSLEREAATLDDRATALRERAVAKRREARAARTSRSTR